MNKITKIISLVLAIVFTSLVGTGEITHAQEQYENNTTQKLIELYPEFKESIDKDTTGKLVDSSEVYVKLIEHEDSEHLSEYSFDNLDDDYEVEYYTREELENEYSAISTYRIGNLEKDNCSWLRLDLQVYQGSGQSDYMAYNFCNWITSPKFRFTDGIGISVSTGMVISGDSSTRHATYKSANPYLEFGATEKLAITVNEGGNGILATAGLKPASVMEAFPNLKEYHSFMIQTGVSYNSSCVNKGWITGSYLHKQISIGGIGMDVTGVPNLSIGGSYDRTKGSIPVSR